MRSLGIINAMKRRTFGLFATGVILSLSLALSPAASAITIGGPSDCDNNAIISCGAHSTGALMTDYNSSAYVRAVYAYFGISHTDISNLPNTNVAGAVNSNGTVVVNGKTVANSAITGGRQNIAGSTQVNFQGVTFFKRPPSVSFQQSSLPAFVAMKNGVFQFAIIASCGNAVMAHPTTSAPQHAAVGPAHAVSKPQPKPQPKPQRPAAAPTQVQAQIQAQEQEVNINNSNAQTVETVPQTTTETTPPTTVATPAPAEQPAATQPAASLVNTGPAGTIGVFLAATGLGIIAYRRFILSKILN